MHVPLGPDFEPDSLLGNANCGLLLLDENGTVTLYNRMAVRLLGLKPDQTLGVDFASIVDDPSVNELLVATEGRSPSRIVDRAGKVLDFNVTAGTMEDKVFRVVEVRDGTKKKALESKTDQFEKGALAAQSDWSLRLKATSILQLLRDSAIESVDDASLWDMVRRTGAVLFPAGGAFCTPDGETMVVRTSWGTLTGLDPFPAASCTAQPGAPSTACPHFPPESAGLCVAHDDGRLCLARPAPGQLDAETAGLFAETVSYCLAVIAP